MELRPTRLLQTFAQMFGMTLRCYGSDNYAQRCWADSWVVYETLNCSIMAWPHWSVCTAVSNLHQPSTCQSSFPNLSNSCLILLRLATWGQSVTMVICSLGLPLGLVHNALLFLSSLPKRSTC